MKNHPVSLSETANIIALQAATARNLTNREATGFFSRRRSAGLLQFERRLGMRAVGSGDRASSGRFLSGWPFEKLLIGVNNLLVPSDEKGTRIDCREGLFGLPGLRAAL